MSPEIASACAGLRVGPPVHAAGVSMFPLFADGAASALAEPGYTVLRDALAAGTGRVTEVSEGGSVPVLRFSNDAPHPVLLLDGEELVGCKQNRILNLSILAPARGDIEIPVSCVEMGRWSRRSAQFSSPGRTMYAQLRASKMAQVNRSLREAGQHSADQGEIWASISAKSRRMGSRSQSEAMSGLYEQREAEIERISRALVPQPGQVGAAFALHGRLAGVEWFDAPGTLGRYLPAIVAGYALDAIDTPDEDDLFAHGPHVAPTRHDDAAPKSQAPSLEDVRALLARIAACAPARRPGVGLGEDLRVGEHGLVAAALVEAGRVVHLCAFDGLADPVAQRSPLRRRTLGGGEWV
jgi:hypothetical protein